MSKAVAIPQDVAASLAALDKEIEALREAGKNLGSVPSGRMIVIFDATWNERPFGVVRSSLWRKCFLL